MIRYAAAGILGTAGMITLQVEPALDPAVAALREELMKTLPAIANAKAQMEGILGKAVGPETLLLALFIVFCGRTSMMILDKALDEWRATRRERREREREEREANRYNRPAAPPRTPPGPPRGKPSA